MAMAALWISLGGCTKFEGDIGPWFGSWHLERLDVNGEEDTAYTSNQSRQVMVSFQGDVFNMAYLNGSEIYGSWSYAGEILTLEAGYNAGSGHISSGFDPYPVVLRFPADVDQVEVTVVKITGDIMEWQLIDVEGDLLTYFWRKYP